MLLITPDGDSYILKSNIYIDSIYTVKKIVNTYIDFNCFIGPFNNISDLETGAVYYILCCTEDKVRNENRSLKKLLYKTDRHLIVNGPIFLIKLYENKLVEFTPKDKNYITGTLFDENTNINNPYEVFFHNYIEDKVINENVMDNSIIENTDFSIRDLFIKILNYLPCF